MDTIKVTMSDGSITRLGTFEKNEWNANVERGALNISVPNRIIVLAPGTWISFDATQELTNHRYVR